MLDNVNSYVTIAEIKSYIKSLAKNLSSLTDEQLEDLALESFEWLEINYYIFNYRKLDVNQPRNFPLLHQTEVPLKVKKAQIKAMSMLYEQENKITKEVVGETVGELSKTYQLTGKSEADIQDKKKEIKNYMSDFMVKCL